jgi:hypothetical protein
MRRAPGERGDGGVHGADQNQARNRPLQPRDRDGPRMASAGGQATYRRPAACTSASTPICGDGD